jgi:hypothetical protein
MSVVVKACVCEREGTDNVGSDVVMLSAVN